MEQLQQFPFVQGYVFASLAAFFAFGLVFAVGASRGVSAGTRWFLAVRNGYAALLVAFTAWGLLSGQLVRFVRALGISVLLEMVVFCVIWVGIMYFMSSRYLATKYLSEKAQVDHDA